MFGHSHSTCAFAILSLVPSLLFLLFCTFKAQAATTEPLPHGFVSAGAVERYGTPEQKLENGSIFDYLDGGGIVYLEHGFKELRHREFTAADSKRITLDIYTFASDQQTQAALQDERIAPAGGHDLGFKLPHKAFRYPPDYFIYLACGRLLVYVHVNDDRLADTLNSFTAAVLNFIKE